jgi:hypothetical protein
MVNFKLLIRSMPGGIIYFHVFRTGKALSCEQIVDKMGMKSKDVLHSAVYKHFKAHAPESVSHQQVEFNDYGCLIDFATDESVAGFSIPNLELTIGKKVFRVEFEHFDGTENNNNYEGGARRRRYRGRTIRRRKNTRRARTRKY